MKRRYVGEVTATWWQQTLIAVFHIIPMALWFLLALWVSEIGLGLAWLGLKMKQKHNRMLDNVQRLLGREIVEE